MAVESPAWANQAITYAAEQTRRAVFFGLAAAGGVKGSGDLQVSAPASGMSVNVATGEVIIPGSSSSSQGLYYGRATSTTNLAVSAANPTNPRIDLVCATVNDAAYSGSVNSWTPQVVTGTPTAGATLTNLLGAPALPTSSLVLAYVLVPANATSIVAGDLSDQRVRAQSGLYTPGVSPVTASGAIGSNVTLTGSAWTTVFSTSSLGVGTWDLSWWFAGGTAVNDGLAGKIVAGTGAGTVSGGEYSMATYDANAGMGSRCLIVVSAAGTFSLDVYTNASSGQAYASDPVSGLAGVTGYVAVQLSSL